MKVLQATKRVFTEIGILLPDAKRSTYIKGLIKSILIISVMGPLLVAVSAPYIYFNLKEFEKSIDAFGISFGISMAAIKYFCLRINKERIIDLLEDFDNSVEKG